MFGIVNFPLFLISCILLNLTPGQDTVYIVSRSVSQGKKAGIVSVLGIMSGVLLHTLLAALGLSMILTTSSLAFGIVKSIGAGYLIWIGIGFVLAKGETFEKKGSVQENADQWKLYRQGVLTNLLNPKVALFFLSFLPQFVDPGPHPAVIPFLLLGMVFFTTGSIWCIVLAYGASWLTARFRRRPASAGLLKKLTGCLFVALGVKVAFSRAG